MQRWSVMGTARVRASLGVLCAFAVLAGCSGTDASGDEGAGGESSAEPEPVVAEAFEGADDDDFYVVPDPLPEAEHGTLLRYEELTDVDVPGGTAWRVMYLSESLAGDPIAVTGVVTIPDGEAPAEGWKLITVAHGTSGSADECAPSKSGGGAEMALGGTVVEAGYALAITDYEGLGTPGIHPYLVGPSEGRSTLDAALAARQLPDAGIGDRYAIFGYSQGGHGATWANELADVWAPDLELVGTVAGAPPSEMQTIFTALAGAPISPDFFFMIVAGYHEAYPEADPSLVLTDAGMEVLDAVDEGCFQMGESIEGREWSDLVRPDVASVEPWASLLADNDPGTVATDHPLLVVHSASDEIVPAALSEAMFNRLCGLGQVIERRLYDDGNGHGEQAYASASEMFAWIEARMAGEPAISTCPD